LAVFQYANNPQTTLAGAVTAGATAIDVTSGATFPTRGKFTIVVDSEIMHVTGVSGTTWTVERGKEGTSAAAHNNNAAVTGVLTRDSLLHSRGLDARTFGATGDGATDDTAALQAALDALAGAGEGTGLFIPAGTYKITAPLVIPFMQHQSILGAGWQITKIVQYANNVPVVKTSAENTHSIDFGEMTLSYNEIQPVANTAAIALNFRLETEGTGQGWYYWQVRRLLIERAHIGIGDMGPGTTGSAGAWNCTFDQIVMNRISQTMIRCTSLPVNTFRNVTHINNGGVAPQGPAIVSEGSEMTFHGLDIEDWYNRLFSITGGGAIVVTGMHIERHVLNTTSPMFYIANGPLSIEGGEIAFDVQSTANAVLFSIDTGGSLRVNGSRIVGVITSGTITGLVNGAGRPYEFTAVKDENNVVTLPSSPIGSLGYAQVTATQAGISTEADLTGVASTVTVADGHRIRITFSGKFETTTAEDRLQVQIKEGATGLVAWTKRFRASGNLDREQVYQSIVLTPSAGAHTYKVTAARVTGTGTFSLVASATDPAWILVEDIGHEGS